LAALIETIHEQTGGESRLATLVATSNLDIYQVNSTYYAALGKNDRQYLLARAIQFFAPGIPQVYYVGLLAGENDLELLAKTGVGRDINRHYYDWAEVEKALEKPVVQDLMRLIRFRNEHVAFQGKFSLQVTPDHLLGLRWDNEGEWAELVVDFQEVNYELRFSFNKQVKEFNLFERCDAALK
jgi:sucrose phosphorylase